MMASCVVAQRRDRDDRREAAAVLADVGQLVDVLDAARGLEHQRLEARRDRGAELDAQRLGARDHFLRIGDVGRRDLVHHLGGGVAQHALGADVEDLDDALRVGGDAGEVGAVEDRVLQGARLEQRLLAPGSVLSVAAVFRWNAPMLYLRISRRELGRSYFRSLHRDSRDAVSITRLPGRYVRWGTRARGVTRSLLPAARERALHRAGSRFPAVTANGRVRRASSR